MEELNMTVFYMTSSGKIKNIITGTQTMDFYADEKDDMSLIIDFVTLPIDQYVIKNPDSFIIDISTKTLKLKDASEITKYM